MASTRPKYSCLATSIFTLSLAWSACEPVGTIGGAATMRADSRDPFIIDGQLDTGHPSVALLNSEGGLCTGSLLGVRTILTAAHCITMGEQKNDNSSTPLASTQGFTVTLGGRSYGVSRIVRHPGYVNTLRSTDASTVKQMLNDLALLFLTEDVQGITALPLASNQVQTNWPITIVGFGRTGAAIKDSGTKRVGYTKIKSVKTDSYELDEIQLTCNGDSGGPSFVVTADGSEVQVGVHSWGTGCATAWDVKTSAFRSWIEGETTEARFATATPRQAVPPTASAKEGEPCSAETRCIQGLSCTPVSSDGKTVIGKYCMTICQTAGGAAGCDGGETCTDAGNVNVCFNPASPSTGYTGGTRATTPPATATAQEGESCSDTKRCATGLGCVGVTNDGGKTSAGQFCMTLCQTLGADPLCNGNESCTAGPGINVCFDASSPQTGYTSKGTQTPPASSRAGEGQACSAQKLCAQGLSCQSVSQDGGKTSVGSFCFTICEAIGDYRCDGGEKCVAGEGVRVCFDANRPQSGFTD